jgi:phospholipid/cholesterol/gamma-HCH transport system ATP-binding protein
VISLRNISKRFGPLHVLDGFNLEVAKGETLVVLGPSGTGKSVMLKIMAGLLEPDSGEVWLDGRKREGLSEGNAQDGMPRIGFLFQGAALFDSLTVEENVIFALRRRGGHSPEQLRSIAEERLQWVGLKDVLEKKPAQLSGGMRKRVGLARAIADNPDIILYDEPTTGLDPIMSDAINQLIVSLKNRLKVTAVAVTHDMASAFAIGDRLALVYQGKVVEQADVESFRRSSHPMVRQFVEGKAEGPIQLL